MTEDRERMSENLKPCPFCGEAEALSVDFSTATSRWTVWCSACDSGTFHSADRNASIALWNRRALPATQQPGEGPRTAPASCPHCHDESDCSNVDICRAVDEQYQPPHHARQEEER